MCYMAENDMFICLVPYTSADAFSGQCDRHHDKTRSAEALLWENHGSASIKMQAIKNGGDETHVMSLHVRRLMAAGREDGVGVCVL